MTVLASIYNYYNYYYEHRVMLSIFLYSYKSNTYVVYNIQCAEGRLAMMNVIHMDLEPKNCHTGGQLQ